MVTIPNRDRGELTEEEERALRDPNNWDWERTEIYEGIPDPKIVFRVELDHAQMAALSAIRQRDKTNPVDIIQRYVDERIEAEYAALAAGNANYAESA